MGRYDEALQQTQRAYELNPLWVFTLTQIGLVYQNSRNYERALEYFNRAIERAPDFGFNYINRGTVLWLQGHPEKALPEFEKAAALGISPIQYTWLGIAYAQVGRRSDALKILSRLKELSGHRYVDPIAFVGTYWALGDKDRAFQGMNKAYDERSYFMTALKWPMWDPLRSDPRFQVIYKKVGLPP
jgi:tetratricopeptide (TPR) repeat protein